MVPRTGVGTPEQRARYSPVPTFVLRSGKRATTEYRRLHSGVASDLQPRTNVCAPKYKACYDPAQKFVLRVQTELRPRTNVSTPSANRATTRYKRFYSEYKACYDPVQTFLLRVQSELRPGTKVCTSLHKASYEPVRTSVLRVQSELRLGTNVCTPSSPAQCVIQTSFENSRSFVAAARASASELNFTRTRKIGPFSLLLRST
jgi:hypothetical protein